MVERVSPPSHYLRTWGVVMRQALLLFVLAVLVAVATSPVASASLQYDVVLYTGFPYGSMNGGTTLTPYGTIGSLTAANVEGWSISFTSPSGSSTISYPADTLTIGPAPAYDLGGKTTTHSIEYEAPFDRTSRSDILLSKGVPFNHPWARANRANRGRHKRAIHINPVYRVAPRRCGGPRTAGTWGGVIPEPSSFLIYGTWPVCGSCRVTKTASIMLKHGRPLIA